MGNSLAYGIARRPRSLGWLVTPADLPFVQSITIEKILDAGRTHTLAAPTHQERRGHPVWFDRCYYESLCALTGPHGAKSILTEHRKLLNLIEVDDPGCILDIDHPADLPTPAERKS